MFLFLLSIVAAANNVGLVSVSSQKLEQLRRDFQKVCDRKRAAERQAEQAEGELLDAFSAEISNLQQELERERQLRVTAEQQINYERELRRTAEQHLEREQDLRLTAEQQINEEREIRRTAEQQLEREQQLRATAEQQINDERELRRTAEQHLEREQDLRLTAEQQINEERELRRTAEQQLEREQQMRATAEQQISDERELRRRAEQQLGELQTSLDVAQNERRNIEQHLQQVKYLYLNFLTYTLKNVFNLLPIAFRSKSPIALAVFFLFFSFKL